jgi:hypothetical protein
VLAQGSTRDCTRPGWETRLSGTTVGVGLGGVPHASRRVQEICRHELHTRRPHVETRLSAHRRRPPPLPPRLLCSVPGKIAEAGWRAPRPRFSGTSARPNRRTPAPEKRFLSCRLPLVFSRSTPRWFGGGCPSLWLSDAMAFFAAVTRRARMMGATRAPGVGAGVRVVHGAVTVSQCV